MTEQVEVTDLVRSLVESMLRMLIAFEMELTAYYLVLQKAQERIIQAGIPWDMASNVRTMLKTPALQQRQKPNMRHSPHFCSE